MEVEVRSLGGETCLIKLDMNGSLLDLRTALKHAFGVPLQEQMIHFDAVNPGEAFRLCGPDSQTLAAADVVPGVALFLVRQDPRTTSEKNCILLEALKERRLQDALDIMCSSGFPVEPNCVHNCRSQQGHELTVTHFIGGHSVRKRVPSDVRDQSETALSLAVRARKQWNAKGEIVGEGASEDEVIPVIQKLLALGADVDAVSLEFESCGSWPDFQPMISPLYLAVQTGSPTLIQLLLDAGANPDMGRSHYQFASDAWIPCDRAASSLGDAMKKTCLALLESKRGKTVCIPKCPDEVLPRRPKNFYKNETGPCRCRRCTGPRT
jgi:hypothetical protein